MLVYLINIALIIFWAVILKNKKNNSDRYKAFYCGIVALQWTLVSGLRHISVGRDTRAYMVAFENVKSTSWETILKDCFDYLFKGADIKDPGYDVFEKVFQIFSKDYQIYLLFIGALFSIALAVWVYRNSQMPCLSFIIYSTLFYAFYAITGHRQTVATALVVLIGYEAVKEKKLIKFLVLCFIAFMLHKSSIVFLPVYFIANIPITPIYVIIALSIIGIFTILGVGAYGPLVNLIGYDEESLFYNERSASTYATVLVLVCVCVLIFYPIYKNKAANPKHIFNINLLTLWSALAVFQSQSFMRIQQYYSLFIMIFIPELVLCFKKRDGMIVYLVGAGILIIYICIQNPSYRFFFA